MIPAIAELIEFLEWLRASSTHAALHNLAGREIERLIDEGFDTERDPFGRPWPKSRSGGKTLQKSGRLRASTRWTADARGVRFSNDTPYGGVHQRGATIRAKSGSSLKFKVGGRWVQTKEVVIPKRQFFLNDDEPLPAAYADAIGDAWWDYIESRWSR